MAIEEIGTEKLESIADNVFAYMVENFQDAGWQELIDASQEVAMRMLFYSTVAFCMDQPEKFETAKAEVEKLEIAGTE